MSPWARQDMDDLADWDDFAAIWRRKEIGHAPTMSICNDPTKAPSVLRLGKMLGEEDPVTLDSFFGHILACKKKTRIKHVCSVLVLVP